MEATISGARIKLRNLNKHIKRFEQMRTDANSWLVEPAVKMLTEDKEALERKIYLLELEMEVKQEWISA